jgi:hypothetical protein
VSPSTDRELGRPSRGAPGGSAAHEPQRFSDGAEVFEKAALEAE